MRIISHITIIRILDLKPKELRDFLVLILRNLHQDKSKSDFILMGAEQ